MHVGRIDGGHRGRLDDRVLVVPPEGNLARHVVREDVLLLLIPLHGGDGFLLQQVGAILVRDNAILLLQSLLLTHGSRTCRVGE